MKEFTGGSPARSGLHNLDEEDLERHLPSVFLFINTMKGIRAPPTIRFPLHKHDEED
jgi:hypothetical protein